MEVCHFCLLTDRNIHCQWVKEFHIILGNLLGNTDCDSGEILSNVTFTLCDKALSKSLFRAARMPLFVEGVFLRLMNAPEVRVEDPEVISALVAVGWWFICWFFCAREVTPTIWIPFSSSSSWCCISIWLFPWIFLGKFTSASGFEEVSSVNFLLTIKLLWRDASRQRFWTQLLFLDSCDDLARGCICADDELLPASRGLTLPGGLPWNSFKNR